MQVPVQIRFSDFDPLNHVNNVAFFEIMETARVEFVRSLPRTLRGHLVVRRAECDYEGEIHGGVRSVVVTVCTDKIGTSSFTLSHEIRADDRLVGVGRVVMVVLDDNRERPRPLDDAERAALAAEVSDSR